MSFNEAGAGRPRMLRSIKNDRTRTSKCFNEAGAGRPRMPILSEGASLEIRGFNEAGAGRPRMLR